MKNRCKTCKHLSEIVNGATGQKDGFFCGKIDHENQAGPDDLAIAQDYEGYGAWLKVKEDFGCVLWEEHC